MYTSLEPIREIPKIKPISMAKARLIAAKVKNFRLPGAKLWFEYHCNEAHDSSDAPVWYRSHERVTVISVTEYEPGLHDKTDARERGENGFPLVYRARWSDGFEWDVFEDELMTK